MKLFLLTIAITIGLQSYAQKASFKELRLKPNSKYYKAKEATIFFPIVVTNNIKIDKLINEQIKEDVFEPDAKNQSLQKIIAENINEYGLINLSFEATYNNHYLLSFSIFREGCGAYCSSENIYFNFDLLTGKKVSITDIIQENRIDSFRNIVLSDKVSSLNKYKIEEKALIGTDGIDSATYDWVISEIDDNCIHQVSLKDFSISDKSIEILDPCGLPHAIQSQEPVIELKYSFELLEKFLTTKFKKLLK
ncbi:MAG TPA: hypothetical protein VKT28_05140 [Puia sp.]|nr:hypothetical protein [Puia sp.]